MQSTMLFAATADFVLASIDSFFGFRSARGNDITAIALR